MTEHVRGQHRWFQVSLRQWLLATLLFGAIAGLFGPAFAEWWQAVIASPPPVLEELSIPDWYEVRASQEPDGYYESAETPLR